MRWKEPKPKDTRVKRKFLIIPRTFNGETRWLEFANIKEEYCEFVDFGDCVPGWGWCEMGFAD